MRRKSVLLAAGVLAIAAGVLPLIGLSWVQREQALGSQQQHLDDVAASTAKRTERTLDDAKRALLRAGRIDRADCSPEHLKEMGQVVADARSIEDLGYFRDGQLVCTRLGVISPPVPAGDADLDLGDGSTLSYAELPRLFRGEPRVEVRRG
ncbi:MAG: CSS-motif domain-containing protein [Stenotrophomonas sp.]